MKYSETRAASVTHRDHQEYLSLAQLMLPYGWEHRRNAVPLEDLNLLGVDISAPNEEKSKHTFGLDNGSEMECAKDGRKNDTIADTSHIGKEKRNDEVVTKKIELPFGWENRMNAVPVEQLNLPGFDATSESNQGAKKKIELPFGWESRMNAVPIEKFEKGENLLKTQVQISQGLEETRKFDSSEREFDSRDCLDLLVATRLHFKQSDEQKIDQEKVLDFIDSTLLYSDAVAIAFGGTTDTFKELEDLTRQYGKRVSCIYVNPWGQFVPALNALVQFGNERGYSRICFQSLEVRMTKQAIQILLSCSDQDTLVVGAAFPRDHLFSPGLQVISGRTCPWNTLAIWNTEKLALTGFLLVAEGRTSAGVKGGVEEVSTITCLQKLVPQKCKAKLVMHPLFASGWTTSFTDPGRLAWHKQKMQSKVERPAAQLDLLGVDPGIVEHLAIN